MSRLDLNSPPSGHKVSVEVKPEETAADRNVRLFKDVALFVVALIIICAIAYQSYVTMTAPNSSADEKKWAMAILTTLGGGLLGYLLKK